MYLLRAMELLLLVEAVASVLVLLASVIGVIFWEIRQFVRSVTELFGDPQRSDRRRAPRPLNQWDPRHPLFSKRAGQ
jgi:hypothetical protein